MAFKLRSGNKSPFKAMGSSGVTDEQRRKNLLKVVPNEEAFNKLSKIDQEGFTKKAKEVGLPMKPKKSPAKQRLKKGGEAQDEDKIFDRKGKHVGNYVNDKKVMFTKKQLALMPEGDQGDFEPAYPGADVDEKEYKEQLKKEKINKGRPAKRKSPAKQKKTFPKSYTKKDIEFLKEQREDVVRREDLDKEGRAIYDANKAKARAKTKAKFEKLMKKHKDKKNDPTLGKSPAKQVKGSVSIKKSVWDKMSPEDRDTFVSKSKEKKKASPAKQADKRKGLGPSTAFGGVLNPELVNWEKRTAKKRHPERKVMKDGSSSRAIYKGKVVKGWTNPYAVKPDRSPKPKK